MNGTGVPPAHGLQPLAHGLRPQKPGVVHGPQEPVPRKPGPEFPPPAPLPPVHGGRPPVLAPGFPARGPLRPVHGVEFSRPEAERERLEAVHERHGPGNGPEPRADQEKSARAH